MLTYTPAKRNPTTLQAGIARATVEHVRAGLAADWRGMVKTYPVAFDLTWHELDDIERIEAGLTAPTERLKRRMAQREAARYAAMGRYR